MLSPIHCLLRDAVRIKSHPSNPISYTPSPSSSGKNKSKLTKLKHSWNNFEFSSYVYLSHNQSNIYFFFGGGGGVNLNNSNMVDEHILFTPYLLLIIIIIKEKLDLAKSVFRGEAREATHEESAIRVSSGLRITKGVICKIQFFNI